MNRASLSRERARVVESLSGSGCRATEEVKGTGRVVNIARREIIGSITKGSEFFVPPQIITIFIDRSAVRSMSLSLLGTLVRL